MFLARGNDRVGSDEPTLRYQLASSVKDAAFYDATSHPTAPALAFSAAVHIPPEPDTFSRYNPLQQLSYFAVVFVLAPLAILTGPSMSPALTNRFKWYPRLPANRQIGRSIHFLIMCAFVIFIVGHVAMVMLTGFVGNLNHIVVGINGTMLLGLYLGLVGIGVVVATNAFANWIAWRHPRAVQYAAKIIVTCSVENFRFRVSASTGIVATSRCEDQ